MLIYKFVCHRAIDRLFQYAIPDIRFFEINPNIYYKGHYPDLENVTRVRATTPHDFLSASTFLLRAANYKLPDLFIVDDVYTSNLISYIDTPELLWYCHGRYKDMPARILRKNIGNCPTIYPSEDKKNFCKMWKTSDREVLIPIALLEDQFYLASTIKNGRACIARNSLINKLDIYPGSAEFFNAVRSSVEVDIFGINPSLEIDNDVNIPIDLADYSCFIEPFGNISPSFCMLEAMAAGIPVVMRGPKEGFSKESSGIAYFVADTVEEFTTYVATLTNNSLLANSVGQAGQEFVRENFDASVWAESVRSFVF